MESDELNYEIISDNTIGLLYDFIYPKKNNGASADSVGQLSIEKKSNAIVTVSEQKTVATPTLPIQSMSSEIEFGPIFEIPDQFLKLFANTKVSNEVITTSNRPFVDVNLLTSLFATKLNLGFIPKINFNNDGIITVQMPHSEGEAKTTFIFSEKAWSNIMKMFASMTGCHEICDTNQQLVKVDDCNIDNDNDDGDFNSSSDSSSWGSPLSPNTFHSNLAALLNVEENDNIQEQQGARRKLFD